MNNRSLTKQLVLGAFIAALYAVLTYLSAALSLAYGPIQLRLSEALTVFSFCSPFAVIGVTAGCVISNIASSLGPVDMLFGGVATFLSSFLMYKLRHRLPVWALLLLPVVFNAVSVGLEISLFANKAGFFISAFTVALGEAAVIYLLGLPLYNIVKKKKIL